MNYLETDDCDFVEGEIRCSDHVYVLCILVVWCDLCFMKMLFSRGKVCTMLFVVSSVLVMVVVGDVVCELMFGLVW